MGNWQELKEPSKVSFPSLIRHEAIIKVKRKICNDAIRGLSRLGYLGGKGVGWIGRKL